MAPALCPGSLIVLEGLDRSGKSTQADRLRSLEWESPGPTFMHMPSGVTELTQRIYRLTESESMESPLARQLLHMACHAENMAALTDARRAGGVVLDRWWWSTIAYGWYGAGLDAAGVDESVFFGMIDAIWARQSADVVFLFTTPYERDDLNRDSVRQGYEQLADWHPSLAVKVPPGTQDETSAFLVSQLRGRGLLL
jgi:dTMP kinase